MPFLCHNLSKPHFPAFLFSSEPLFKLNFFIFRIKFDKIKKTDAGIYTCRSEDNRSSNLTLSVLPGGEIKKNFNSNMKVFSQVAENVTEQNEHLDLNNDDNADDSEDYTDKEQTKVSNNLEANYEQKIHFQELTIIAIL